MFGIENFKLFVFTVLVVNLTPGASVVFVISKSLSRGIKPAIFGALGLGSGILVYAMLTAFGLSALIASNAPLFHTIKIAGALYLIFLGIRSLLNKPVAIGSASSSRGYFASWKEGTLINILNPLIILFFLSVLPQFVKSDNQNAKSQLLFLGIWMALSAIFVNSSYAIVFGFFGKYLVKFPQALTYIQRGAGILLIAIGIVHLF